MCNLQAPESEITVGVLKNREEKHRLTSEKGHNLPLFKDLLEHVDMDAMSLDEQSVIVECNRVAFWKFSLPCMFTFSGLSLLMFEKGFLQIRPSASYPRLPKLFLAALVGYTGGQVRNNVGHSLVRATELSSFSGVICIQPRLQQKTVDKSSRRRRCQKDQT